VKEYIYKAISPTGVKINDTLTANSVDEVKKNLKDRKLIIISIGEVKKYNFFSYKYNLFEKKLKLDDVSHFCRQFSIIISSGVNSIIGLETLSKRSKNKLMKSELERIVNRIKMGWPISEAIMEEGSKFPKLLGAMVSTGEATGTIEEVFKTMATFYEREYRTRQKIKNSATYPAIVVIASVVMLFVFSNFVMPRMLESILQSGAEIPILTKVILSFSNIVQKYWYIILILVLITYNQLRLYLKTAKGRYQKDLLLNKVTLIGKILNTIVAMRFSKTLFLCVSTGFPLLQGLEYIKENVNNAIAENVIDTAREGLTRGESLAENLDKSKYFDPVLIQMVSIGEQTGQLEEIMKKMSEFYEQEADIELDKLISMIEPMLIIVVGIIVTILIISVFLPMISLYDVM
jgi:type IV pilus assembly protein PilC